MRIYYMYEYILYIGFLCKAFTLMLVAESRNEIKIDELFHLIVGI